MKIVKDVKWVKETWTLENKWMIKNKVQSLWIK